MIQNQDLILLLTELEEEGVDVEKYLIDTATNNEVSLDTLKFINSQRQLDVTKFYERIRKNYNDKKSNLYKNIVRDIEEPLDILTTLSAFALQVILFSKHASDVEMFLKHIRVDEVTKVLNTYYTTYNIEPAIKTLRLIKCDLKAFESLKK